MEEFVEKLIGRLEEVPTEYRHEEYNNAIRDVIKFIKRFADKYEQTIDVVELVEKFGKEKAQSNNGWFACSERLPEVETTVLIHAKRKYMDGGFRDIITTAMYEDGTMLENDSKWRWEDIEGEWDEENDCYIIPEGWWEDKKYNEDGELNHAVDDVVLAWRPLPKPYKGE